MKTQLTHIPLLAAILTLGACAMPWSSSTAEMPRATPQTIARQWCEDLETGKDACLASAEAHHRQCITTPGRYDACRQQLLRRGAGG